MNIKKTKVAFAISTAFLLAPLNAHLEEVTSNTGVKAIPVPISNEGHTTTLGALWDKNLEEIKELVEYEIISETNDQIVYIGFGDDKYSLYAYNFDENDKLVKYNSLLNETFPEDAKHLEIFFELTELTDSLLGKADKKEMVPIIDNLSEEYDKSPKLWPEAIRKNEFFVENTWDNEDARVTILIMSDDPKYINDILADAEFVVSYDVNIK